jgi:hypothetical protein
MTAPNITIITPINADIVGWNVLLRANVTDIHLDSVEYDIINGTVDSGNIIESGTMINIGGDIFNATFLSNNTWPYDISAFNLTNLTLIIYANDTLGNEVNASTYWVLDNTQPNIQHVTPPQNGMFVNGNFSLEIWLANHLLNYTSYNITNETGDVVQFNETDLRQPTFTWADLVNVDSLPEGNYTLTTFALDSSRPQNSNMKSTWFYIDRTVPTIAGWVYPTPENNTFTYTQAQTFNFTCNDSFLDSAWINFNGTINSTLENAGGAYWMSGTFGEGNYLYTGYCNDTAGNSVNTEERTLMIDLTAPRYSNNITSPESPTIYVPLKDYDFNITWSDTNGISTTMLVFNGINYTMNYDGAVYYLTLSDWAAGSYVYYFWANDSAGNVNQTGNLIYTIEKAPTNTSVIVDPASPIIYGIASNFSCYNNVSLETTLYVDGINVTDEKGLFFVRGAANYSLNCTSYDNENYTGSSDVVNYTINRAVQTALLAINPAPPLTYGDYANVTCNGELFRNDANVTDEISTSVMLAGGSYNYSCKLYEDENYTYDDDNATFLVNRASFNLTLNITPSNNVNSGTQTNVSGTGCPTTGLNCTLFRDNVNVSNPDVATLGAGTYNYLYETLGNENYTGTNVSANLTVIAPSPSPGPGPCTDVWGPLESSVCKDESFTQTSNCGATRTATGTSEGSNWTCGNWTECINNAQSRDCTSECNTNRNESRACYCNSIWNCTEWSRCISSTRTRTCEDMNDCSQEQGRPSESESCGQQPGCAENFLCGEWSGCDYQNRVDDIINGEITYDGIRHRECTDVIPDCADDYTDYENCTSNVTLEMKKEEVCGKEMLTAVNTKTGALVASIDMKSWESNRLDVAFTQKEVVYCPYCYNGIKDGSESGIDCGGECRACKPESRLPIALFNWMLWILAAILLLPILKISRDDDELLEYIRALIKSGEEALNIKDRKKAANNFREIKWLYVQIESKRKKRVIFKEIQKYHRKISSFYEL